MTLTQAFDVCFLSLETQHNEEYTDAPRDHVSTIAALCDCKVSVAYKRIKGLQKELVKSYKIDRTERLEIMRNLDKNYTEQEKRALKAEKERKREERVEMGKGLAAKRWGKTPVGNDEQEDAIEEQERPQWLLDIDAKNKAHVNSTPVRSPEEMHVIGNLRFMNIMRSVVWDEIKLMRTIDNTSGE
jgi:hypothetical protein